MKNFLVLGGNGYIGKYIVDKLSSLNNNVIVADYNVDDCKNTEHIKYKKIDFTTCENFDDYLIDIDVVIHLVSTTVPSEKTENIIKELSDNVFPTIKLLDSIVKNSVQKIVFISSGGTVYGEHNKTPIKENEEKNPICNYGILKALIEKYLELYGNYYDLNYNVIRLSNPYSEKTKNGQNQGIIPIIIDQILSGKTVHIWGNAENIRDYIYIDDVVEAIIKIIKYTGKEKIFNVGTGVGHSIHDILKLVERLLPKQCINIKYTNNRKCDVRNNILDVSKAQLELNWTPTISLEAGITKVIEKKRREMLSHEKQ